MSSDLAPTQDLSGDHGTALTLFGDPRPNVIVARATAIADVIAPLIRDRNLVKRIHQSEHVYLEGWTLAGTMLGVFATTARTWEIGSDDGYGATVEARTMSGALVGRADAVVMRNEEVGVDKDSRPIRKWERAPAFQLISMAQTRASSKALRMPLGFVMKLAGYDTTPAEEMEAAAARGETVTGGKGVAPGWRDKAEQHKAHQRLSAFAEEHGLSRWIAEWLDSKGYPMPLSKAQMADLRRAVDRELKEDDDAPGRPGDDPTAARPAGSKQSAAAPAEAPPAGAAADPQSPPEPAPPTGTSPSGGDLHPSEPAGRLPSGSDGTGQDDGREVGP